MKKTPIAIGATIFPYSKKSTKKVPKALLKQKNAFLNTMKMEQIRSAKATIKENK